MRAGSALGQRGKRNRQRAPRATVGSGGALCGFGGYGSGGRAWAVLALAGRGGCLCLKGSGNSPKEVGGLSLGP